MTGPGPGSNYKATALSRLLCLWTLPFASHCDHDEAYAQRSPGKKEATVGHYVVFRLGTHALDQMLDRDLRQEQCSDVEQVADIEDLGSS